MELDHLCWIYRKYQNGDLRSIAEIFLEEKEKLDLENTVIQLHISLNSIPDTHARKENDSYICNINEGHTLDLKWFRSVIRHELYHITAGHCESEEYPLWRNIINEIPAMLYQYLGINLSRLNSK